MKPKALVGITLLSMTLGVGSCTKNTYDFLTVPDPIFEERIEELNSRIVEAPNLELETLLTKKNEIDPSYLADKERFENQKFQEGLEIGYSIFCIFASIVLGGYSGIKYVEYKRSQILASQDTKET
ncbi:MAG: hypothetical protein CMH62_00430 [Nanoarchaeota archaeon]|nr:hypothetical protein [Nanoarchaeota archaeon]|tara:strand:- start:1155 stop:1532 length:378 start_codon:yes stop_codon:yes gene_type:complete